MLKSRIMLRIFTYFLLTILLAVISVSLTAEDIDEDGKSDLNDFCIDLEDNEGDYLPDFKVDGKGCTCAQKTRTDCAAKYPGADCCIADSDPGTVDCGNTGSYYAVCNLASSTIDPKDTPKSGEEPVVVNEFDAADEPGVSKPEKKYGEKPDQKKKIMPVKDEDKYLAKEVFLVSDLNWEEVLPFVPVSVWTDTKGVVHKYPFLVFHEEEYGFDADSIIYFLQQYDPERVTIIGYAPQELVNLLVAQEPVGAGLSMDKIRKISVDDYYSYWSEYDSVVVSEDNYGTALLATTYASLINSPFVIDEDPNKQMTETVTCVFLDGDQTDNSSSDSFSGSSVQSSSDTSYPVVDVSSYFEDQELAYRVSEMGIVSRSVIPVSDVDGIAHVGSERYIVELEENPLLIKELELKDELIKTQSRIESMNRFNPLRYVYSSFALSEDDLPKELLKHSRNIESEKTSVLEKISELRKGRNRLTGDAVLSSEGQDGLTLAEYKNSFNGFVIELEPGELNDIRSVDGVKDVYEDGFVKASLMDSISQIGADKLWLKDAAGNDCATSGKECINGSGVKIAIIDTGVDYTHPDLGGSGDAVSLDFLNRISDYYFSFALDLQLEDNHVYYLSRDKNHNILSYDLKTGNSEFVTKNEDYVHTGFFVYNNSLISVVNRFSDQTAGIVEINLDTGEETFLFPFTSEDVQFYGKRFGRYLFLDLSVNVDAGVPLFKEYVYDIESKRLYYLRDEIAAFAVVVNDVVYTSSGQDATKIYVDDLISGNSFITSFPEGRTVVLDAYGDDILLYHLDVGEYGIWNPSTNVKTEISLQETDGDSSVKSLPWIWHSKPWLAELNDKIAVIEELNSWSGHLNKFYVYDRLNDKIVSFVNLPYKVSNVQIDDTLICFGTDVGTIFCFEYNSTEEYNLAHTVKFNQKVIGGYDIVNQDQDPMDDQGHGTHVAAIASGNGVLKGVAPGSQILAYKVLDSSGYGLWSFIIEGIELAVDPNKDGDFGDRANILSLSLGGAGGPDSPVSVAVNNAVEAGSVVVVAAGNDGPGQSTIGAPGSARRAITVAAVDDLGSVAKFSSRGPVIIGEGGFDDVLFKPDISAPGVDICAAEHALAWQDRRCLDDKHVSLSGTSMATPHVSGVAALLKQAHPDWSPDMIKSALMSTSSGTSLNPFYFGAGVVDAGAAISFSSKDFDPVSLIKHVTVQDGTFNVEGSIRSTGFTEYKIEIAKLDAGLVAQDDLTYSVIFKSQSLPNDEYLAKRLPLPRYGKYILRLNVSFSGKDSVRYYYFFNDESDYFSLMPGWPKVNFEGVSGMWGVGSTPLIDDLDGDGDLEIIVFSLNRTSVWHHDGSLMKGWPREIQTGVISTGSIPPPAIGDIDGDGKKEIVLIPYFYGSEDVSFDSGSAKLCGFAWELDGFTVPGWDNDCLLGGPAITYGEVLLYDVDLDGRLEIIFRSRNESAYSVHVFDGTGNSVPGWPRTFSASSFNDMICPEVADVDDDGLPELVFVAYIEDYSKSVVLVYGSDGVEKKRFRVPSYQGSMVLFDINSDGKIDIGYTGAFGTFYFYDFDGNVIDGWDLPQSVHQKNHFSPIMMKEGNGVVYSHNDGSDLSQWMTVLDGKGVAIAGWPKQISGFGLWVKPQVADIDGDGSQEIFLTSSEGLVYGWNVDGTLLPDFPIILPGLSYSGTAIGDIDNDGVQELVAGLHDGTIYVWKLIGSREHINQWPMWAHDSQNTNLLLTESLSCSDSDGKDYFSAGKTMFGSRVSVDSCKENILTEYYCNNSAEKVSLSSVSVNCEFGCRSGACLRTPPQIYNCTSELGHCSGEETCTMSVSGSKNTVLSWKSSCGLVLSKLDGRKKTITFDCANSSRLGCGNGIVEAPEVCEVDSHCDDGNSKTSDSCIGCKCSNVVVPPRCGDGIVDSVMSEECDSSNFGKFTDCVSLNKGYTSGALKCNYCKLDVSGCVRKKEPICGDGTIDSSEECDSGINNGVCPSMCSGSCKKNTCTFEQYFAEGATIDTFKTRITLTNPNTANALVILSFLNADGSNNEFQYSIPSQSTKSVLVNDLPGMSGKEFSTVVYSDVEIVADRLMSWGADSFAASSEKGISKKSKVWYFAEGATHSDMNLFYLLQNPSSETVVVKVKYLLPSGQASLQKEYTILPKSRKTIWVNNEDPVLASNEISAIISADSEIIAERAMYSKYGDVLFRGGHASAGVTMPSKDWFMAEGSTGNIFDMFILLENPADVNANVKIDYLLDSGDLLSKDYVVAANSRMTLWVNHEDAALSGSSLSAHIKSDIPIVAERSMWWPKNEDGWHEAHNSFGSTESGIRWGISGGYFGGSNSASTYLLIANPSSSDAIVEVTLFPESRSSLSKTFTVPAKSRFTINAEVEFPGFNGNYFGAVIFSKNNIPIVVEKAIYWDAQGKFWSAGANSLGTLLVTSAQSSSNSITGGVVLDGMRNIQGNAINLPGFENTRKICIGNVFASAFECDENYTVAQMQKLYVNSTKTDKVILVNPDDWSEFIYNYSNANIRNVNVVQQYGRTSLMAPILASAKHEVILPINSKDPDVIGAFVKDRVYQLMPYIINDRLGIYRDMKSNVVPMMFEEPLNGPDQPKKVGYAYSTYGMPAASDNKLAWLKNNNFMIYDSKSGELKVHHVYGDNNIYLDQFDLSDEYLVYTKSNWAQQRSSLYLDKLDRDMSGSLYLDPIISSNIGTYGKVAISKDNSLIAFSAYDEKTCQRSGDVCSVDSDCSDRKCYLSGASCSGRIDMVECTSEGDFCEYDYCVPWENMYLYEVSSGNIKKLNDEPYYYVDFLDFSDAGLVWAGSDKLGYGIATNIYNWSNKSVNLVSGLNPVAAYGNKLVYNYYGVDGSVAGLYDLNDDSKNLIKNGSLDSWQNLLSVSSKGVTWLDDGVSGSGICEYTFSSCSNMHPCASVCSGDLSPCQIDSDCTGKGYCYGQTCKFTDLYLYEFSSRKSKLIHSGEILYSQNLLNDKLVYVKNDAKDYYLSGYLTVMAAPNVIPQSKDTWMTGYYDNAIALDQAEYADVFLDDNYPDMAAGRIYGITSSDVSSYVARSIFVNSMNKTNSVGFTASSFAYMMKHASDWTRAFRQAGYDVTCNIFLDETPNSACINSNDSVVFNDVWPQIWANKDLINYLDHGAPSWAGISSVQLPILSNSLVFNDACSTCQILDCQDCGADYSFCANVIRKGGLSHAGAVSVAWTGNRIYMDAMNGIYRDDLSLGQAFSKSYVFDVYTYMTMLLGDPTLKVEHKSLSDGGLKWQW